MAAAVLTKNVLLRTRRCHQALRIFRQRTCSKHSTPDTPIAAQKNIIGARLANQFLRYKWPSSIFSSSGSSSSSSSEFGFVGWYMGMIKTRPVSTKSITCALIYTAADLSSQSIDGESSDGYDLVRTLRMAGYGMLIIGPSLHYWFNFVSRVYPKRDILSTFKKMALGQTVYGPVVTTIFFSANAAAQGESGAEIIGRLKRDLIPTLINGAMYWPACDFLTFKFIPVHLQPLVSNSFSYLWTVYLTYMASLTKVRADC